VNVPVYRIYRDRVVPNSANSAGVLNRQSTVRVGHLDMEAFGQSFLASYTRGDNGLLIPTDSMKNFVLRRSCDYTGETPEGLLYFLGDGFLRTYSQAEEVLMRIRERELPLGAGRLFAAEWAAAVGEPLDSLLHGECIFAELRLMRDESVTKVTDHRCGLLGLGLLKSTGSAFEGFVRDEYTTLPYRRDRPLFIVLDALWRYRNIAALVPGEPRRAASFGLVRRLIQEIFERFESRFIQHLLHEIGSRLLAEHNQLVEISFEAQNRVWNPVEEGTEDSSPQIYTEPFPAYGVIKLTLAREG